MCMDFNSTLLRLLLGRALVEMGKWAALEPLVGSADHPAKEIPVVGEALSSCHVASWYALRARYRAEQGLLNYADFDCGHVSSLAARISLREDRDNVLRMVEDVRDRIKEIKMVMDRRGRDSARGRKAGRGH